MKYYGNYGEMEGSQVMPLCNAGKNFHMTHLSAFLVHCAHISVENNEKNFRYVTDGGGKELPLRSVVIGEWVKILP